MELGMLAKDMGAKTQTGDPGTEITGLSHNSREVSPGDLFFALRGDRADGHVFIGQALQRGASAVVREGECPEGQPVPCVLVEDTRGALASAAHAFYGRPSEGLAVTGITGTNGKTTTAFILKSILEKAGHRVGLVGTIRYSIGEAAHPAPYTTPEAPEFQGLLRRMLDAGCTHVVTEVSSHALAQRRVDETSFACAVFTNLTPEHLDFHHAMEEYFFAKQRLFHELHSRVAVINVDDAYGKKLAASYTGEIITYAVGSDADLRAHDIRNSLGGLSFRLASGGGEYEVHTPLIGTVNVYNVLAAAGAARALSIPIDTVLEGVRDTGQVKGRFEKVELGQDFLCIIDFAHTEDALRRAILTARELTKGRLITVFGCGGDRDRGKRPVMGAAAAELSDMVFVTSDNPRTEKPDDIIAEILSGVKSQNVRALPDRGEAIREAIREARPSDTVLIAGKGHEDYQEIMGERLPFSDAGVASEAIRRVLGRRNG
jgi:UDP-N-acetylmuramoyl-L-alanyl-D-glutamate--2,6-diaminopimelate ligase